MKINNTRLLILYFSVGLVFFTVAPIISVKDLSPMNFVESLIHVVFISPIVLGLILLDNHTIKKEKEAKKKKSEDLLIEKNKITSKLEQNYADIIKHNKK